MSTYTLPVGDHGKEIAVLSVIHDYVHVVTLLDYPVHGDHTAVGAG